jgi:shikimate kinase
MNRWDGKNIYFMGFMGTGKSRIGFEFSKLVHWRFVDTDDMIEDHAHMSITQLFAQKGEKVFRQIEKKILRSVAEKQNTVVSLGGGATVDEDNWRVISQSGLTICLHASIETLVDRLEKKTHRPLVANTTRKELYNRVKDMLKQRQPHYDKAQYHFTSNNNISPEQFAKNILTFLREDDEKINR